jgi:hypothetical protein
MFQLILLNVLHFKVLNYKKLKQPCWINSFCNSVLKTRVFNKRILLLTQILGDIERPI